MRGIATSDAKWSSTTAGYVPWSRRPVGFLAIACAVALVLLAGRWQYDGLGTAVPSGRYSTPDTRLAYIREQCNQPDPFEAKYGRPNLRRTRGYEGSLGRMERFVAKVLRGEPVKVGVLGGSVTKGHHVEANEVWTELLQTWLNDFYIPKEQLTVINGAAPATGSDYFSYCFSLHIPLDVDLVFIELGINDLGDPEDLDNMEHLLRGLLILEKEPAVVLYEAFGYADGEPVGGGGGRMHSPLGQYYDVPVVTQRYALTGHFQRFPSIVRDYMSASWDGGVDYRHFNARGHSDTSNLLASLLRDTTCNMIQDPSFTLSPPPTLPAVVEETADENYAVQAAKLYTDVDASLSALERGWADDVRSWYRTIPPPDDDPKGKPQTTLEPGIWTRPTEYGQVPRLQFMNWYNADPNDRVPTFKPTCYSTKAHEARFNLTPTYIEGFEWEQPDGQDKPYIMTREVGARIAFEIEVHDGGMIKLNYLRSERMSLGKMRCWVDDGEKNGEEGVVINGYWKRDWLNLGAYSVVAEHLKPGLHRVNCLNLNETDTADGGHEFRFISIVSS